MQQEQKSIELIEVDAPPARPELGSRIDGFRTLKYYIGADLRSRGNADSVLRTFFFDPVARFTILMRILEYLQNTCKPAVVRLPLLFWYRRLSIRLGFSVAPGIFGPGAAIVHYGLLIIHPAARIGRNCRIHAGVNIGAEAGGFVDPADLGAHTPRIGHNVYIGPGAKLFGPVVIGDSCVIGANAVVTRSFRAEGLTLAGVPARVIAEGSTGERVIKGAD